MRRLSARVSEDAHDAWRDFCEVHGVTFTAIVEAAGQILASGALRLDQTEVIDLARKIDRERAYRS